MDAVAFGLAFAVELVPRFLGDWHLLNKWLFLLPKPLILHLVSLFAERIESLEPLFELISIRGSQHRCLVTLWDDLESMAFTYLCESNFLHSELGQVYHFQWFRELGVLVHQELAPLNTTVVRVPTGSFEQGLEETQRRVWLLNFQEAFNIDVDELGHLRMPLPLLNVLEREPNRLFKGNYGELLILLKD